MRKFKFKYCCWCHALEKKCNVALQSCKTWHQSLENDTLNRGHRFLRPTLGQSVFVLVHAIWAKI